MKTVGKRAKSGILLGVTDISLKALGRLAQLAESAGYDCLWYADERFYRDTYVSLSACALATSRILLGPAVTDPYTRHPALTAAAMASLDELSEGRAMLGYGAGLSGFHNLGIVSDRPATALREGIYIIRRLWAGEHTTYEGEIISLWDALMKFPTRHDLPIYVAANSPYTLRLAGEVADGVIIPACASKHILEVKLQRVREGQKKAGRVSGPEIVARLDVSLSQNRDAALFEAKVRLARLLWARYPHIEYLQAHDLSLSPELDRRLRQAGPFQRTHDRDAFVHFADVIPDELVFPISLAGTPTEVRNQAQAVVNAGAEQIMAYMLVPGGESVDNVLTLYAEHVLPHLRLKQ